MTNLRVIFSPPCSGKSTIKQEIKGSLSFIENRKFLVLDTDDFLPLCEYTKTGTLIGYPANENLEAVIKWIKTSILLCPYKDQEVIIFTSSLYVVSFLATEGHSIGWLVDFEGVNLVSRNFNVETMLSRAFDQQFDNCKQHISEDVVRLLYCAPVNSPNTSVSRMACETLAEISDCCSLHPDVITNRKKKLFRVIKKEAQNG